MNPLKKISAIFLPLLLLSCQQVLQEREEAGGETVLRVGIASVQTKTWLDTESGGSPIRVYWSDGDRINVNGQVSSPLQVAPGKKVSSDAEFHLRSVDAPYRVIYPASAVRDEAYAADGTIGISIPSQQAWTEGGFAVGAAPLYGYADGGSVTLHNLFAAIRVRLSSADGTLVDNASLSSDDAPLCGDFKLDPTTGILEAVNVASMVSLTLDPVALKADGTDFYFTIPPGNYTSGLRFAFVREEDHRTMQCTWTPEGKVEAGRLYYFDKINFVPGAKDIETVEEWEEFAAAVNSGGDLSKFRYKDGVVRLGADIEAENLTRVENWLGVFDGQGHVLRRTAATSPVFRGIGGEVRNLVLEGAFTGTFNPAMLADTLRPGGKISACINRMSMDLERDDHILASGIVRIMSGGIISGCVNEGALLIKPICTASSHNVQLAGIAGQVNLKEEGLIENCTNKGSLTIRPTVDKKDYNVCLSGLGGIAGWHRSATYKLTLKDCTNEGKLHYDAANVTIAGTGVSICVGGIIGLAAPVNVSLGLLSTPNATNGMPIEMDNCVNKGQIHNQGINQVTSTILNGKVFTGGIAGAVLGKEAGYALMKNCRSEGNMIPYDVAGGSDRAAFCPFLGGLAGWGGFLKMEGCEVNATIGTLVRQSAGIGGGIGCCVRPFTMEGCHIYANVNILTVSGWNANRALAAVVPMKYINSATTPAPTIAGSVITDSSFGGTYFGSTKVSPEASDISDWSNNPNNSSSDIFYSSKYLDNLVSGHGYSSVSTDVDITNCAYWSGNN